MKKLALVLIALAVGIGAPGAARAEEGGNQNNYAIAVNTKDGSSLFKLAFKIRKVAGDVVDAENAAVAYSSCTSCKTTAIAFEIVLVTGTPSTVTPNNVAIAVNDHCNLCTTFATAYQFVISTGGPVRFTQDGRRELAAVRKALHELKRQDLSPAELDRATRELAARVQKVLDNELVPARGDDGEEQSDENDEEQSEETVTTQPTSTATQPSTTGAATTTTPTTTGATGTTTTAPVTTTGETVTTTGTTTTGTTQTTTIP